MTEDGEKTAHTPREDRYTSHALVELKRFRYLPFAVKSAVLLDISPSGFKVELTGEQRVQAGDRFWLSVPLGPLGIYAPSRLVCRGECRWFDETRFRLGGVFMELSKTDRHIIDQIVETLIQRGMKTQ